MGQLEVRHHEVLVVLDVLCGHTEHAALQTGPCKPLIISAQCNVISLPSSSGQYWPHLVLALSMVLVVITITCKECINNDHGN